VNECSTAIYEALTFLLMLMLAVSHHEAF